MQGQGKQSLKRRKTKRSRRVSIESPVLYRETGQIDWLQGMTANISESGVLFRADREMEVQTTVQMNFQLPAEITGKKGSEVFCTGKIVRTVMPPANDDKLLLAARILASKHLNPVEEEAMIQ